MRYHIKMLLSMLRADASRVPIAGVLPQANRQAAVSQPGGAVRGAQYRLPAAGPAAVGARQAQRAR